eukprot:1269406-Pyramimonas_sp.AAC.2
MLNRISRHTVDMVGWVERGFKVTLLEKEATFGGHTLTDDSASVPVDLGFQVRIIRIRCRCVHPRVRSCLRRPTGNPYEIRM